MRLEFSWQLPLGNEGISLDQASWARQPGEWIQLAQAVEYAGIDQLWIPAGPGQADSLGVAAALCAHTRALGLTVSVPPEVMLPAALAATGQSLQSISGNRLRLHLPDGEQNTVRRVFGEFLNRDQRNERIGEYITILGQLLRPPSPLSSVPFNFSGRYFQLENAGIARRDLPAPVLILDDSQSTALLADHAQWCLLRPGHPHWLRKEIHRLQSAAQQQGNTLKFACNLGLIVRNSEEQAWDAAQSYLAHSQDRVLATSRALDSEQIVELSGQHSQVRRHEIHPNFWRPFSDQPALLVGTPKQIATRLQELHGLGVNHICLQALPAVSEALRFAEQILPLLQSRGLREENDNRAKS